MSVLIIPARYDSTRFPGKMLAEIHKIPMVVLTAKACLCSNEFEDQFVLTDNLNIHFKCLESGINAVLMETEADNGTERIAKWAVNHLDDDTVIVNCQGDEPMMDHVIPNRIRFNVENKPGFVWTAVREAKPEELNDVDAVKCLVNNGFIDAWSREHAEGYDYVQLGVYGYTVKRLKEYLERGATEDEKEHKLEQLRWKESLACITVDYDGVSVDRPADIQKVEERMGKA